MGIIYVDEKLLQAVAYLINKKEQGKDGLKGKIKNIAEKGVRAVTSIQLGPVTIDPSRIRDVPKILWNTQAAEEYLESEDLKNSLSDVINGILNQEIPNYDILSITCKEGIKEMGDSYDENGDKRPTFKDASLLYFYENDPFSLLTYTCIRAKLMSFEEDTRLFFRCYFRKIEEMKVLFRENSRLSVTIFGFVYDDVGEYLIKQTRYKNQDFYRLGKKALLVVAASGEGIDLPWDVIFNRHQFLSE